MFGGLFEHLLGEADFVALAVEPSQRRHSQYQKS